MSSAYFIYCRSLCMFGKYGKNTELIHYTRINAVHKQNWSRHNSNLQIKQKNMLDLTTNRIRWICNNDIKLCLMLFHKLESIADVNAQFWTFITLCHEWQILLCHLNNFLQCNETDLYMWWNYMQLVMYMFRCMYSMHKKWHHFYFLMTQTKMNQITFGIQNPEETSHQKIINLSVLSGCQTPFFCPSHLFVLYLACAVSVPVPKMWNSLPPALKCVLALTLSAITSRSTISSKPSRLFLEPQIRLLLTIVCVSKLYLLTYFTMCCDLKEVDAWHQ